MLKTKKLFLVLALAALSLCSMYTIGCAAVTEQQAMVSGEVAADGLVQVGAQVQHGDVLVKVKSLAGGSIAAARATTSGKVAEVMVKPGDRIVAQQVVAKISE